VRKENMPRNKQVKRHKNINDKKERKKERDLLRLARSSEVGVGDPLQGVETRIENTLGVKFVAERLVVCDRTRLRGRFVGADRGDTEGAGALFFGNNSVLGQSAARLAQILA